jgi:hypothetical protein
MTARPQSRAAATTSNRKRHSASNDAEVEDTEDPDDATAIKKQGKVKASEKAAFKEAEDEGVQTRTVQPGDKSDAHKWLADAHRFQLELSTRLSNGGSRSDDMKKWLSGARLRADGLKKRMTNLSCAKNEKDMCQYRMDAIYQLLEDADNDSGLAEDTSALGISKGPAKDIATPAGKDAIDDDRENDIASAPSEQNTGQAPRQKRPGTLFGCHVANF